MKKSIIVTHHELSLDIVQNGRNNPYTPVTNISVIDVFKVIKNLNYENETRFFGNSRFCGIIPLIEIDEINNRIDLILALSDKDEDDQIVRDFNNTANVRALVRNPTEGVDERVHIVIKQDDKYSQTAYFALEHKTHLTPKFFADTLNYFIKNINKNHPNIFFGNHPTERDGNNNPKRVNVKLKFSYSTALSDEIIDAFAKGRVKNVTFEEPVVSNTFDQAGNFFQHKRVVFLDVSATVVKKSSKTMKQRMNNVIDGFKSILVKHPNLKGIKFTIKFEGANGQAQTAYYDSATQEFSLAKKTSIEASVKQRASAVPVINKALCDRMFAHI